MLKKLLIIACLVIACSLIIVLPTSGSEENDSYNPDTDAQIDFMVQGMNQGLVAFNNRYYFTTGHDIYYMEQGMMEPTLFVSTPKAECIKQTIDSENCKFYQFINSDVNFMAYYDNALYTIQRTTTSTKERPYHLVKISLEDGSRQIALTFNKKPSSISLHRGNLYVTQLDEGENYEHQYQLIKYNMELLSEAPKVIYENANYRGSLSSIYPYGNKLYFIESIKNSQINWEYNLKTKQLAELFPNEAEPSFRYILSIHNNDLMYSEHYISEEDDTKWTTRTRLVNRDTLESVPSPIDKKSSNIYLQSPSEPNFYQFPYWNIYYGQELDMKTTDKMTIYNLSQQAIGKVTFPEELYQATILPGDKHYMFFYTNNRKQIEWYLLDKSKIGSSDLEIKKILSVTAAHSVQYVSNK